MRRAIGITEDLLKPLTSIFEGIFRNYVARTALTKTATTTRGGGFPI